MNTLVNRTHRSWAYAQLMRPANIVTALADILAGFAASGAVLSFSDLAAGLAPLEWLLVATIGLYGGGVVFNDVFDAELDASERPERPIPSGRATRNSAALLGGALLLTGVVAAWQVSRLSAALAAFIALAAVFYDAFGKRHPWFGPLNMGACRGGNLLLGVSAVPMMVANLWFLALIPITYIAAITTISRGEVHGGERRAGMVALLLIGLVSLGILALGLLQNVKLLMTVPFLVLFWWLVVPPFIKAARDPRAESVRAAVKVGVIYLIVLDATLAAGFAGWLYGLVVLFLVPVAIALARLFAVT